MSTIQEALNALNNEDSELNESVLSEEKKSIDVDAFDPSSYNTVEDLASALEESSMFNNIFSDTLSRTEREELLISKMESIGFKFFERIRGVDGERELSFVLKKDNENFLVIIVHIASGGSFAGMGIFDDESVEDRIDDIEELFENISDTEDDEDDEYSYWYDDFSTDDLSSVVNDNKEAAKIVLGWYDNEDAYEDFDSVDDYIDFIRGDLPDMIDAATDPREKAIVKAALRITDEDE